MATTVEYNPAVIQKYATRLYTRANSIILFYSVVGGLLGALVPFGAVSLASAVTGSPPTAWAIIGLLFGALLGFGIGSEKALQLKLQAQQLMCQVSIESNTLRLLRASQQAEAPSGNHAPPIPQQPPASALEPLGG